MRRKTKTLLILASMISGIFPSTVSTASYGQDSIKDPGAPEKKHSKTLYGQASFYANKFHGRMTANGETFNHDKFTAACNVVPLGTWVKVTNLRNGKSIIVRTNDRLHPKTRRIIDLTKKGAKKLDFIKRGLTRVKIEILDQKKYNDHQ